MKIKYKILPDTCEKIKTQIESAIENIQASGDKVTYSSVSRESGLSYYTIYNLLHIEKDKNVAEKILTYLDGDKKLNDIALEIGVTKQAVSLGALKLFRQGKVFKNNKNRYERLCDE